MSAARAACVALGGRGAGCPEGGRRGGRHPSPQRPAGGGEVGLSGPGCARPRRNRSMLRAEAESEAADFPTRRCCRRPEGRAPAGAGARRRRPGAAVAARGSPTAAAGERAAAPRTPAAGGPGLGTLPLPPSSVSVPSPAETAPSPVGLRELSPPAWRREAESNGVSYRQRRGAKGCGSPGPLAVERLGSTFRCLQLRFWVSLRKC